MLIYTFLCAPREQGCLEAALTRQEEVDGLSPLAQQVLEETYISSRVSVTATQLTARYHSLLLNIQVTRFERTVLGGNVSEPRPERAIDGFLLES